jgi:hypothetical protein
VLCHVRVFRPDELRDLSFALWGNQKFPYIFFFRTEELTLSWPELREHLGYAPNFDPRGNFYSVVSQRLDTFGGVEGYVRYLREHHSIAQNPFAPVTEQDLIETDLGLSDDEADLGQALKARVSRTFRSKAFISKVDTALTLRRNLLNLEPQLVEKIDSQQKRILIRPRRVAFAIGVKRAYRFRCAVCDSSLQTPNGRHEVQAAHIFPRSHEGSDDLRNGLCLCGRHHWALDVGWMSLSDDHRVLVRSTLPEHKDYDFIRRHAGKKIQQPTDIQFVPHPIFTQAHRKLVKFD